jgi:hypothetical protein
MHDRSIPTSLAALSRVFSGYVENPIAGRGHSISDAVRIEATCVQGPILLRRLEPGVYAVHREESESHLVLFSRRRRRRES